MKVTSVSSASLGIPNFEPMSYNYDFVAPLLSSRLCKNGNQNPGRYLNIGGAGTFCDDPKLYTPSKSNRYFMSVFGPRMRASDGVIRAVYDFHRGEDIVDGDTPTEGATMPDIRCMCDGIVHKIKDGTNEAMELTEEGRYVTVKCNAIFNGNAAMGNVYTAYRHLSTINSQLKEGATIAKGTLIGKMGNSGKTELIHLHFSVQKMVNNKLINVHPMRIFNPYINRHLLTTIDAAPLSTTPSEQKKERVNIFLLGTDLSSNQATIRIAVPYKKASIRAIVIKKGTYKEVVDFEQISQVRDNQANCCTYAPPCVPSPPNPPCLDYPIEGKLELFVLPFNRGDKAITLYNRIAGKLPATHTGNLYPMSNEEIFTIPAYVLDIKATGLPMLWQNIFDLEVYVVDIWGNAVKGTL